MTAPSAALLLTLPDFRPASGPPRQVIILLQPRNTLGRHPSNSIQLLETIISKQHCAIDQRGDDYVLRDLGSMNGTYVNGRRLSGAIVLQHGDEIRIGETRARFELQEPAPESEPLPDVQAGDCVEAVSQRRLITT